MAKFEIRPSKTALLLIDMQNEFLKPEAKLELPAGRRLIPKLKELIRVCRSNDIVVIFTRHVLRKDGSDEGIASEFLSSKICLAGSEGIEFYREIHLRATFHTFWRFTCYQSYRKPP